MLLDNTENVYFMLDCHIYHCFAIVGSLTSTFLERIATNLMAAQIIMS